MKTKFKRYIILSIISFSILVLGCGEDKHEPYGSDNNPPGKVAINSIINRPGGAVIEFTPPTDLDLLYVKGKYFNEKGVKKEVIVSSYIDSLNINGFGLAGDYEVQVTALDLGNNESAPVTAEISPLEAPIHAILESIQGIEDFGGINISYENPTRANVSLNMSIENDNGDVVFKLSI